MNGVTLPSARSNLKRSSGPKSNVVDVPIAKHRYVESTIRSDPPLSGKVTYNINVPIQLEVSVQILLYCRTSGS